MNLNFQTRLVVFYWLLFVGVQCLTLAAIYWFCRHNMLDQAGQNLVYAEHIFNRQLTAHGEKIADETGILVADFGFRSAVSDGDRETVASALENLTYRGRGKRGFFIDMRGQILADTAGREQGRPFMFQTAIATADATGRSVVFGMLDGEFCELAVVPVLAPLPIGWVGIATPVDRRLVNSFKHLVGNPPDISLISLADGQIQVLTSSLAKVSPALFRQTGFPAETGLQRPTLIATDDADYMVLVRPLAAANAEQPIVAVLQIDVAEALRPYAILIYTVVGLMIFSLLAALIGGYLLARNITQPLRALTRASRQMMNGRFDPPLPVGRNDELGSLARTFRMAGRIAAEMDTLQARDQQRRELVASVSHDLRSPLASLHGYLETMQHKAEQLPAAERERFLEIAVRQSAKVGKLAQELFELARLECDGVSIQPEIFNIQELIQDVAQKFQIAAATAGVALQTDFGAQLLQVNADIAMLERVLTNLVDNALRHTPAGGRVRLLAAGPTAERVLIGVEDTGTGIAPEQLARLFDRHSPLRGQGQRGGLGLLIVARMLALHGSRIQVVSQPGQGSTFSFELPAADWPPAGA